MTEQGDQNRSEQNQPANSPRKEAWEWLKALVVAFILAVIIRQFLFANFLVDGQSMMPTLHDRERIIVNKIVYHIHKPEYNEIVVFKYPGDPSKDFIKRVIGMPGDTIEVRDYKVYRNGQPLNEPYIAEPTVPNNQVYKVPPDTIFVMGDNRNYSKDSRDPSVGYVPDANIEGRAELVWWPLTSIRIPRHS